MHHHQKGTTIIDQPLLIVGQCYSRPQAVIALGWGNLCSGCDKSLINLPKGVPCPNSITHRRCSNRDLKPVLGIVFCKLGSILCGYAVPTSNHRHRPAITPRLDAAYRRFPTKMFQRTVLLSVPRSLNCSIDLQAVKSLPQDAAKLSLLHSAAAELDYEYNPEVGTRCYPNTTA